MNRNRYEEEDVEPNITPLIDIVFILLIFFLVTTTFAKDLGIEVERPEASSGAAQESDVLRVAVGRNGEVTVAACPASLWNLSGVVQAALDQRREKSVLLVADQSVSAGALVEVMDACKIGGASQVAVAVEGTGLKGNQP